MPRKFLVVVDDSPEFESALRYAARRARSTGGRVALLRVIPAAASDAHWFYHVTGTSYPEDPTGNQTRFEMEVLAKGWNSGLVETS